jgi:hypothetical protein
MNKLTDLPRMEIKTEIIMTEEGQVTVIRTEEFEKWADQADRVNADLLEGVEALNKLQLQYRKGLTDIVKHMDLVVGGHAELSTAYRIATNALKE